MSSAFIFSSIFEIILAAAVILVVVKDGKLVEFEDKLVARLRAHRKTGRHLKVISAEENYPHCA